MSQKIHKYLLSDSGTKAYNLGMSNSEDAVRPLPRLHALGLGAGLAGAGALWIVGNLPVEGIIKREFRFIAGTALVGAVGVALLNEALGFVRPVSPRIKYNKSDALWADSVAKERPSSYTQSEEVIR